jgi:hypothetical protein
MIIRFDTDKDTLLIDYYGELYELSTTMVSIHPHSGPFPEYAELKLVGYPSKDFEKMKSDIGIT